MSSKAPLIARNRDFSLLWTVKVLSQAGARMFQIALIWWIVSHQPESSGLSLGIFMVMGALPAIVLASWIGKLIDRHPSRLVLLAADGAGALVSLAMALAFASDGFMASPAVLPVIYASSLLFAVFNGFIDPTLNKAVPELVEDADVGTAVAFLSSTTTLASFAGAIAGAVLIEKIGIVGIIVLNGLAYLLSVACDLAIRFRYAKPAPQVTQGAASPEAAISGWQILKDRPLIKKLLLGFGAVNFFGTPLLVLMPIYTKDVLKGDASTLSVLEALVWLGILGGTFFSGRLGWQDKTIRLTAACLAAFGASLAVPGVLIGTAFYGASLFTAGFALGIMNVRLITFFQHAIEDQYKGRFFALLQAVISFAVPVGYFVFGALTDLVYVPHLSLAQGAGVLLLSLFFVQLARGEQELSTSAPVKATNEAEGLRA